MMSACSLYEGSFLTRECKNELISRFQERVHFNEPMSSHTSLRVGGSADIFVSVWTEKEILDLMNWCRQRQIEVFILGGGTNLLVKDSGIRGMVISMSKTYGGITMVERPDRTVSLKALAGGRLSAVCRYAAANGLSGMNFAVGIPGSVGGAVAMNAGTSLGEIGDVLEQIRVLFCGEKVEVVNRDQLSLAYRHFGFVDQKKERENSFVILSATFRLIPGDPARLKLEANQIFEERKQRQPWGMSSAGSFFKNPSPDQPAGRLIDEAGLKGLSVGDAQVSEQHANFILNRGNASAKDILELMQRVQETVFRKFQIHLKPEVIIIGA